MIYTQNKFFQSTANSVASGNDKKTLTFIESFKNNTISSQIGNVNKRSEMNQNERLKQGKKDFVLYKISCLWNSFLNSL